MTTEALTSGISSDTPTLRSRRPGVPTVYRWEMRKLISLKRTYLGFAFAIAMPVFFVLALSLRHGQPNDIPFGNYVRESGLAVPLVLLVFGSVWLFPLITALVAGDVVASEDHNGTLKMVLTRSVGRGRIFAAKLLVAFTYAFLALVLMGVVALIAGIVKSGFHPLISLSGTKVSAPRSLGLVWASLAVYLLPMLAIASIGVLLSTVFRNSAAAVVGTLMVALLIQLIGILPGLGGLQPYLLTTQFDAWQGFLRTPTDWGPIVRGVWDCAAYAVPSLVAAYLVFIRRDVAGG